MDSAATQIEKARKAMKSARRHRSTVNVEVEEKIGSASIDFQFAGDASLSDVRSVHGTLITAGWEEVKATDSNLRAHARYEWDKSVLTDD